MEENILNKLNEVVNAPIPSRPTKFQIHNLMLGKEPTIQAKLMRCVEELRSRKRDIENLEDEIEESYDRMKLADIELEEQKSDDQKYLIKQSMHERRKKASERRMFDLRVTLEARKQEVEFFLNAYYELIKLEPQKNWDDDAVQTEYWEAKLLGEVVTRAKLKMPPDQEVMKTIQALPDNSILKKSMNNKLKEEHCG